MAQPAVSFVDAFTGRPFRGNPAGVCVSDVALSERWMQSFAAEINLSETAFVVREGDQPFPLRWFTPTAEVELCGHATLASAHILWESDAVARDLPIRFSTLSGILTAAPSDGWIDLDFPAVPANREELPPGLLEALRLTDTPLFFGRTRFDYLIEVADEQTVRGLSPDFERLRDFPARGTIVTSRSDRPAEDGRSADSQRYDFVSRFFAPQEGVNEDPVTGSAHASLLPYWSAKLGRLELLGYQASARGGFVRVRAAGDRVIISGQAVTTMRAELAIPAEEPIRRSPGGSQPISTGRTSHVQPEGHGPRPPLPPIPRRFGACENEVA